MLIIKRDNQRREQSRRKRRYAVRMGLTLGTTALTIYFLWALSDLIFPIIVGAFLAYLFKPALNGFRPKFLPDAYRIPVVLTASAVILIAVSVQTARYLPGEKEIVVLKTRLRFKVNQRHAQMGASEGSSALTSTLHKELRPMIANVDQMLALNPQEDARYGQWLNEKDPLAWRFADYYFANRTRSLERLPASIDGKSSPVMTASDPSNDGALLKRLMAAGSTWIVMPLVFLFLLVDRGQIMNAFFRLVPNRYFEMSLNVVDEVDRAIGAYLRGTLLQSTLVGAVLVVGFVAIGLSWQMSLLIGVISGLANAIPFVGTAIGLALGVTYSLIAENVNPLIPQVDSDSLAVWVGVVVAVAHLLDNVVFQPIVLGSAVNLHPLVVIIGVLGGSMMFGFAGMLLAIPTIVVFKVVVETVLTELKAYRMI